MKKWKIKRKDEEEAEWKNPFVSYKITTMNSVISLTAELTILSEEIQNQELYAEGVKNGIY